MICAIARTGSNLLTDGLHTTRRAGKPKQFFLPKFEGDYGVQKGLDPKEDFAGYVRGIVKESSTSNNVFGFKVMGWYLEKFIGRLRDTGSFGNGSERELLDAAFPRLRFVQILRRNKLRQAISKAKALQSGLWKVQEEMPRPRSRSSTKNSSPAAWTTPVRTNSSGKNFSSVMPSIRTSWNTRTFAKILPERSRRCSST